MKLKEFLKNTIARRILVAIVIVISLTLGYVAARFMLTRSSDPELSFYSYIISEDEIIVSPSKDEQTGEIIYTGKGVTVEITAVPIEGLKVQYKVGDGDWTDYEGPFEVKENSTVKARYKGIDTGYEGVVDDFTGPETPVEITNIAVAKIGDTTYKTLAEAIADWNNVTTENKKIEILADVTENVVIPEGKDIVIDLCGKTISNHEGAIENTPTIIVNGGLNLIDTKGDGKLQSVIGAAISVGSTGTVTLGENEEIPEVDTECFEIKGKGYGIVVEEGGELNFYDGKIIGETKAIDGDIDGVVTPIGYGVLITKDGNDEVATVAKQYVVTADANGGTITTANEWNVAAGDETATKVLMNGQAYGELPVAEKEGYDFVGWNGKNIFDKSQSKVEGIRNETEVSLWASTILDNKWVKENLKPNTTYTVSYDMTCVSVPEYDTLHAEKYCGLSFYSHNLSTTLGTFCGRNLAENEQVHRVFTIETPNDLFDFEMYAYTNMYNKDGSHVHSSMIFSNVQIEEGSTATSYQPFIITEDTIFDGDENTTITAYYRAHTYTINYNANSGTGTTNSTECKYGDEITIANNEYEKTGYTFTGWNTAENGSGTTYQPGDKVSNLTSVDGATINLYATWQDVTPPTTDRPDATSTTNSVTVTNQQTDNGSGIATVQYRIGIDANNDGVLSDSEIITNWQNSDTFAGLSANTTYHVQTKATDAAGNTSTSELKDIKTQTISGATAEVYESGTDGRKITTTSQETNNPDWTNKDVVVKVTLPEDTTGNSTTVTIKKPDGTTTPQTTVTNSPSNIDVNTNQDGVYKVTVTTSDGTNSSEDVHYVYVDKTNPTAAPTYAITTNSITVTPNATDNGATASGIDEITYRAQYTENEVIKEIGNTTGIFTNLPDNTQITVTTTVTDKAGNVTTVTEVKTTNELVAGALAFKEQTTNTSFTPASTAGANKVWINEDVKTILTNGTEGTTTTYTVQKVGEAASAPYNASADRIQTTDGDYVVVLTTTDGYNTATVEYYFSVDKTAPTVGISPNGGIYTIPVGNTNITISATLTPEDNANGSGIATKKYAFSTSNSTEPGSWSDLTDTNIASNTVNGGVYYLWTKVIDNAGNEATTIRTSNAYSVGYEVIYDVQGGNETISSQRKVHNTSLTLSDVIPTKEGYLFKKWSTNADGTGTAYNPEAVYTNNAPLKLYAVWAKIVASTTVESEVTYYDSVQSAIDAAGDEPATVTLLDSYINESVTIGETQSITINLHDNTLTSDEPVTIFNRGDLSIDGAGLLTNNVTDDQSFTIVNQCILQKYSIGTISNNGAYDEDYTDNSFAIKNNGTFTIREGRINSNNGAIYNVSSNSKLNVLGGEIKSNKNTIVNYGTSTNEETPSVSVKHGTVVSEEETAIVNESTGLVTVELGKIVSKNSNPAINNKAGILTLGEDGEEFIAVKTDPVVVGLGTAIKSTGTLNIYDGVIKVPEGEEPIDGTVTGTPTGYGVGYRAETIEQDNEYGVPEGEYTTAVLVKAHYKNTALLTLGDAVEIGDVINYNLNGTNVKGRIVNITEDIVEFMPIDSNGKSQTVGNLHLGVVAGEVEQVNADIVVSWNDTENIVNKEAINNYPGASRALKVEDVNRLVGYTPNPSTTQRTYYNSSATGDKSFIVDELTMVKTTDNQNLKAIEIEGIGIGDTVTLGKEYGGKTIEEITITSKTGEHTNAAYNYSSSGTYPLSNYFSDSFFWLSSNCIMYTNANRCSYYVRRCRASSLSYYSIYSSNGDVGHDTRPVVPVVTISASIPVNKKDETTGEWTVASSTSVAKTLNYFETLAEALENAKNGTTIEVMKDLEETELPTLSSGRSLVLNLKDKTVTLNGVTLTNNGKLGIIGQETGKITTDIETTVYNAGNGRFSVSSGTIENTNENGKEVYNTENGHVNVFGGNIASTYNGIENYENAYVNVYGGSLTSTNIGILNHGNGQINISGGSLTSTYRGIENYENGQINVSGGELETLTSTVILNYGVLNTEASPSVKITGAATLTASVGNVVNNAENGWVVIQGGTLDNKNEENTTPTVLNCHDGKIIIKAGIIKSAGLNSAVYNGWYHGANNSNPWARGTILIKGGTIEASKSVGVHNAELSNLIISGGTIEAKSTGIYSTGKSVTITGGTIKSTDNAGIKTFGINLTLGTNDNLEDGVTPNISKITPTIIGKTAGIQIASGTFNFYDGEIKSQAGEDTSIIDENGNPYNQDLIVKPSGYGVQKSCSTETITQTDGNTTTEVEVTVETATLVKVNYINTSLVNLSEAVEIGDVINYNLNGTNVKGRAVNITDDAVEFMPVDSNGKAVRVGSLRLGYNEESTPGTEQAKTEAIASWSNAENLINQKAIDSYAGATRALTVEDVNRLVGYTPNPSTTQQTYYNASASGDKRFIVDELTMVKTTENEELRAVDLEGITVGDTVKLGVQYGDKTVSEITMVCTTGESTKVDYDYNATYPLGNYFTGTSFWLASRCVGFYSDNCLFNVRYCHSSGMNKICLYGSSGHTDYNARPVVPVVSINANIKVNGKDETTGEWTAVADDAVATTLGYYETLSEAMQNAKNGTTIEVLSNTAETTVSTVASEKTLVLDLKDKNITSSSYISISGALTIKGTGKLTLNTIPNAIRVETSTAKLTKKGTCIIEGNGDNGSIIANKGILKIYDGTVSSFNNKSIHNYNTGKLIIKDGIISAAMCVIDNYGTAIITGGTIVSKGGPGIHTGGGTLTLGDNANAVNITTPCIIGASCGIQAQSGTLNFYDGIIKGQDNAISGTVADTPQEYSIANVTETIAAGNGYGALAGKYETARLLKVNCVNDVIEIGDIINYNLNGTNVKGRIVNITDDVVEFMPVDSDGTAVTVGNLRLGYKERTTSGTEQAKTEAIASWNNAENLVNQEAIKNYTGATRALTVEDVNRLVGYTPNPSKTQRTYTTSSASDDKRFIVDELTMVKTTDNEDLRAIDVDGISTGDTITLGNEYDGKIINEITIICRTGENTNAHYSYSSSSTYPISNYFTSTYCWLASRCIELHVVNVCDFSVRKCNSGYVNSSFLYRSTGNTNYDTRPVVPVVSLSSSIMVWQDAQSGELTLVTVAQPIAAAPAPAANAAPQPAMAMAPAPSLSSPLNAPQNTAGVPSAIEDAIAQIGDVPYTSLEEALENAGNGDTIELQKDITLEEAITIESGKDIKLSLNGKTLTSTVNNTIINNGKLQIISKGIITNENEEAVIIENTGELNITGDTVDEKDDKNLVITVEKQGQVGINNSGRLEVMKAKIIVSEDEEISSENQEENQEENEEDEETKKSYGIYNNKGIVIIGIADEEVDTEAVMITAKDENTVAIYNENSVQGEINFYDGTIITKTSIQDIISNIEEGYEISEEEEEEFITTTLVEIKETILGSLTSLEKYDAENTRIIKVIKNPIIFKETEYAKKQKEKKDEEDDEEQEGGNKLDTTTLA